MGNAESEHGIHRPDRSGKGRELEPYRGEHALLMQIPWVDWLVAAVLICEIGVDMSVFMSVYHLAAWAGVGPGNYESAGKRKSSRARKGNIHVKTTLVGAAISASRAKGSYFKDKFYRLKARRGALPAALAIAHKILIAASHMLARRVGYQELGEACLGEACLGEACLGEACLGEACPDQLDQTRTAVNLKRRLERLGYVVMLQSKEATVS